MYAIYSQLRKIITHIHVRNLDLGHLLVMCAETPFLSNGSASCTGENNGPLSREERCGLPASSRGTTAVCSGLQGTILAAQFLIQPAGHLYIVLRVSFLKLKSACYAPAQIFQASFSCEKRVNNGLFLAGLLGAS
jgi:hypothetical protein